MEDKSDVLRYPVLLMRGAAAFCTSWNCFWVDGFSHLAVVQRRGERESCTSFQIAKECHQHINPHHSLTMAGHMITVTRVSEGLALSTRP